MLHYPESYAASRAQFRRWLPAVQARWPAARLHQATMGAPADQLTLDWLEAPAQEEPHRLFILTTGQHGIEGFVGAAVMRLVVENFLQQLRPADTGLLLVHPINPWGMHHRRRTNATNVDLNRNFIGEGAPPPPFNPDANPDYTHLHPFLNPAGRLTSITRAQLAFMAGALRSLARHGAGTIRSATLLGQYRFPQGIYYGGAETQPETAVLQGLYRAAFERYAHILQLDIHTGYGPRYQMSLVNSSREPRRPADLQRAFDYPLIVRSDPQEFYQMQGDMIEYIYTLAQTAFPQRRLYATAFEFGTLGNSLAAGLRSLRALVLENQAHWHGAAPHVRAWVSREFNELFAPAAPDWRAQALADAHQALTGILRAEGFLTPYVPN